MVCDFCGYLAQVKTSVVRDVSQVPKRILGAAWEPQRQRMEAGIYFPLFLVLCTADHAAHATFYLSADLQRPEIFIQRAPLSPTARRAGWTGFLYDLAAVHSSVVRLD